MYIVMALITRKVIEMENVNKQLLDAAKQAKHALDLYKAYGWADRNGVIGKLESSIAAAEQAQHAAPVEVHGHGTPNVDVSVHDGKVVHYDNGPNLAEALARLASRVAKVRNLPAPTITAQPPAVAVPTIKLSLYGRAFDTPKTRRAYTYREQPDNIGAYKLGRAVLRAASGGDSIDYGLSLLKQLQAEGFGVFELGDQQEGGQQ